MSANDDLIIPGDEDKKKKFEAFRNSEDQQKYTKLLKDFTAGKTAPRPLSPQKRTKIWQYQKQNESSQPKEKGFTILDR